MADAGGVAIGPSFHRAAKVRDAGADRTETVETTLARVLPHLASIGVTRLADVTGLDRIGIPVVLSVRPNGPSLSVDAGKGATRPAATASAVMEAFERHAAEVAEPECLFLSYDEVAERYPVPPLEHLPLVRNSLFSRTRREEWTLGWDLFSRERVALPAHCVRLRHRTGRRPDVVPFQGGSNGLSAGNCLVEAVLGGLLEVVERDAFACHRLGWELARRPSPRVDPATIDAPVATQLLDQYADGGIAVAIFDLEVDTRVPAYLVQIWDLLAPELGIYRGYGAHLDRGVAVTRALAEAAQSRLVFIAGSRDDAVRHQRRLRRTTDLQTIGSITAHPPTHDFAGRPPEATRTIEGDVAVLLRKLAAVGIEQVVVFDLSEVGLPVSVVRIAAPGLEGYVFDNYRPGRRALAYAGAA
ncbi:MAG: YcaO-like family protein [Actinomycetota bacterium]